LRAINFIDVITMFSVIGDEYKVDGHSY
jgi:hypothetical protein